MPEIVNAILYQASVGCQYPWRHLPHDFSPYYYFGKWRDPGINQVIHELLRWQVREPKGRHEDPSAIVMDTRRCTPSQRVAPA
ncbi:hypothetical protein [Streptomyces celluloflavus]|uniref:hypothetical protein n=1 Tax=Streptomyces celluloflavus TaxID=58344 RepID=UPI00364AC8DA